MNLVSGNLITRGFPHDLAILPRQPFHLNFLGSIASDAGDTENRYPRRIHKEDGVDLGVDEPLEEIPSHWPNDKSPPDPDIEPPLNPDLENYRSHLENEAEVIKTLKEEKAMGMVVGPFTETQASEFLNHEKFFRCP